MNADPFEEWRRCDRLRQADIDHFIQAGVPIMALAEAHDGSGFCLMRDRVVVHPDGRRFEMSRYSRSSWLDVEAAIILALDQDEQPVDLVAFSTEGAPFVASWLGRVGMIGEERLLDVRLCEPLRVHGGVMNWLRADRCGVVVVDPVRAAPMLRDAGTLAVGSWQEKRRLADMITVKMPSIVVDPIVHVMAAE